MFGEKKDESPKDLKVIPANENHLTVVPHLSPIEVMQQTKAAGLDVSEMKEMLELQKAYEANEARKAFHQALAEFKKDPPQIVKDKWNEQYKSTYTSIGNMVNTVNEAMGPFGLNARWDFPPTDEDNVIVCTCILAHRFGHEESVTLSGPPDTSGAKNALQGRKSTRTYLKLETFEAVTGTASIEGNTDDDGAGAEDPVEYITPEQVADLEALIEDVEANRENFLKVCKVEELSQIPADKYEGAVMRLNERR